MKRCALLGVLYSLGGMFRGGGIVKHYALLAAAFMVVGCGQGTKSQVTSENSAVTDEAPAQRFPAEQIAAMERQLRSEPKIVDVLHQDGALSVDWQIGVHTDGTARIGYAGYICQLLRDKSLVDDDTDVRIVDIDYLRDHEGEFRDASLGHLRCSDEAELPA